MNKVFNIFQKSVETTQELANGRWPEFLRTAAWNYRYSFPNQVLIFAQQPQATACASMEDWNKKLHRQVKAGAAGIALLEDAGDSLGLSYIFDVSDTLSLTGAPIPLWTMSNAKEEDVRIALADVFLPGSHPYRDDVMAQDATSFYYEVAHYVCEQLAEPSFQDLLAVKDSSNSLQNRSDSELEFEYRTLLSSSITAMVMYRCGLEPDLDSSVWEATRLLSDIQAISILGQATQSLSRQSLEIARSAVRKWDKEHKEEKLHEQQSELSAGRAVPNPGPDASASEASEQIRQDAQDVPAGEQTQPVHADDADRGTERAPSRNRPVDRDAGDSSDERVNAEESFPEHSREAGEPDPEGRGTGVSGDDFRLTDEEGQPLPDASEEGFDVNFPSPQEQESIVSAAVSKLNLTQDEIHSILSQVINSQGVDEQLIAVFQDAPNSEDAVSALQEAFGDLDERFYVSLSEKMFAVSGKPYGIEVGRRGEHTILPWKDVASYFEEQFADFKPEREEPLPSSSADLLEGQVFSLNGSQYRVAGMDENFVSLQDISFPIFTNTIPRQTLDLLLRNNGSQPRVEPQAAPLTPEASDDNTKEIPSKAVPDGDMTPHQSGYESPELHVTTAPERSMEEPSEEKSDAALNPEEQPKQPEEAMDIPSQEEDHQLSFDEVPTSVKAHYIPQILRYDNSAEHSWAGLRAFFLSHPDHNERLAYLREHYGNVYTSIYAENEDEKYISFHGTDAHLEIWEDNYLTTEIRDYLSWEDVCRRVEQEVAIDRANLPSSAPALEVSEEALEVQSSPLVPTEARKNFQIRDMNPHYGGPKARFQNNIAAIRLLKQLEEEGRLATADEQQTLSAYVGWGGLSEAFDDANPKWQEEFSLLKELLTEEEYDAARESTLTAFYTPPVVTEAIFEGLRQLGFQNGNILDPCCGTGNFFGMLPEDMNASRLYGVELDAISGRIARQMYQNANIVIDGYEKTALPDSMFDVAIGNVPFGKIQLYDRRYDKEHFLIHDYFFAKTLDKVRPGGVIAFVTSKGTMDKENDAIRRYIAQRADLLGAIRLPDNTFKENAGTEVVSDILFLQKRERPRVEEPYWVGLDREYLGYDEQGDHWGPSINAYFVENPDMVLGDMKEVSGPHGPMFTCRAREGEDLRTALQNAVRKIEGSIDNLTVDERVLDEATEQKNCLPADPNVRNFSYTVVDGDVYFREDSVMYRSQMNKTAEKRVKGMVNLRNITRDLIEAQLADAPDSQIASLQDRLNTAYDAFTEKFGLLNSTANARAFSDDSSYFLLCSLEVLDNEGNFKGKADMFYKRTIGHHQAPDHVETAQEALAVSMGELARVDLAYMSRLSGLSEEKLVNDLEGLIFPVPGEDGRYEISSVYLSGNIREKLNDAREAAEENPQFQKNIAYLEKAMPEPLTASDISVRLGSTWIPGDVYKDFMNELFQLPGYCSNHMSVQYEPYTSSWNIVNKRLAPSYSSMMTSTYGTHRMNALDILEKTLNLKDVQVYDTKTGPDGETHRILNTEETLAVQEKQQLIKDAFADWIWKDPDRRQRLCEIYNEKFNSIVPPSFSGDMVQFHGLNPLISLDSHQKESVARILYNGNTMLAHAVGAGKTWTMTAAAMEGKYLGLFNKSLVVVPNHLIGQWAAAIYDAYPHANVLASTEKDFEPANRKKFCSRIATGDYDIVVIGHSHFEKIPLSAERQKATIQKEMDDIIDSIQDLKAANGERFTVKKLEAAKKSLQTKLDKLHNSKRRDDVVTFEELGVDHLFVDESHNYKNLFINTKMTNVAGISQTDSQKASDMFVKCRYMDELTGGRGITHATGTVISNTMAELYTSQRYLQYDLLQRMGLGAFDAWASTFGETVVALELAPEGNGYRQRTRFAKFFNVPELMNMYRQVADIRTKDMLNLPVPAVEYQTEVLKPSEDQKAIVKSLGERAEKIRKGGVDSREDNMLCITNDGRKAALDQRLIDPTLPDDPNSKTVACANSIFELYQKGDAEKLTQLVFCDLSTPNNKEFNVYDDLKAKLVAKGIPEAEIRFIHEANTVPQKEALFAKVRSGAVRVLMGSTQKMGTGTCVQDRLIAGHDLDAPWRPSDLEQRDGRVIRRGNQNDKVFIRRYVTEGTFDAYIYQLLEIKQRFNDQVFTSKNPARCIDDVDGMALNFAEIKAMSSGDDRIREKVALEMEISKLEILKSRHMTERFHYQDQLKKLPVEIQGLEERIAALGEDLKLVSSRPSRTEDGKLIPASVKGVTYEKQEETGKALLTAVKALPKRGEWVTLGSLRGFKIQGMVDSVDSHGVSKPWVAIAGKCRYPLDIAKDQKGHGIMMRLNYILDNSIASRLDSNKKQLAASVSDLEQARAEVNKSFANEDVLQEKKARLAVLDEELNLDAQRGKEDSEPCVDGDVEVLSDEQNQKRPLSELIAGAESAASRNADSAGHSNSPVYSRS